LIGFAVMSRRLEALNITAAMFFTSAGLLAGPVLGLLDLPVGSEEASACRRRSWRVPPPGQPSCPG
jgi:hypothetical protein